MVMGEKFHLTLIVITLCENLKESVQIQASKLILISITLKGKAKKFTIGI